MKTLITLLLLTVSSLAHAQVIPNADFENWTYYSYQGTWTQVLPKYWTGDMDLSSRSDEVPYGISPVQGHSGKYAMQLSQTFNNREGYATLYSAPGKIIHRYFNGYIKTSMAAPLYSDKDTVFFWVCDKSDPNFWYYPQKHPQWWGAAAKTSTHYLDWTPFHITLFLNNVPDSFTISMMMYHCVNGAAYLPFVQIDSIFFSDVPFGADLSAPYTPAGQNELSSSTSIDIYPNPASDILHISSSQSLTTQFFDLAGRCLKSTTETTLDISDVDAGIYCCIITGKDFILSRKIIITR